MNESASAFHQVRFPLCPSEGETILSYAFRVGAHNLHAGPLTLFPKRQKQRQRRTRELWDLDPEVLCRIYRQPVEAILPLVAKSREDGRVVIGEWAVQPRDLLRVMRRVSPSGLRKFGADRCDWAIRSLSFCPANWDLLLDACPNADCGQRLTWDTRSVFHCGICGHDLRRLDSLKIRICDRQTLQLLPDLLSREERIVNSAKSQLPPALADLSPEDLVNIIRMVGLGVLAVSENKPRVVAAEYPHEWITGIKNLQDPVYIQSIVSGRNQPALYRLFTGEMRRWLSRLSTEGAEIFRNFLDPEYRLAPARGDRLLSVTMAASKLRVERSAVRRLVQLGHLETFKASGAGKQRRRDLITDVSVAALTDDRASISSISAEYKIPKAVLLGLVSMGVLEALDHPAFSAIYSEVQLKSRHARALLASMSIKFQGRSSAWPVSERVAAKPLLHSLGGGDHLWANLIGHDLNGRLEFGLATTCRSSLRLDAILLHQRDAEAISRGDVDLAPGELSQSTAIRLKHAETRLCMHPRDIQILIGKGQLTRYETGVLDASVRDAAKRFISTREISRLTGIGVYEISMAAAARGLARLWPRVGIWDRTAAMTAFADLVDAGVLAHAS